jgi:chromosome segregation and condensation protein ScpB
MQHFGLKTLEELPSLEEFIVQYSEDELEAPETVLAED